jgi:signal peptidase I
MRITEQLANLPIWAVLVIVAVLFVLRFALLKLRTPAAKSVAEIAESLAVAMALVFLLIRPFIVQAFFIPSASMHPTLLEDDHILVNKFIYRFREPRLGDVVVFKAPLEATPDVLTALDQEADSRGLEGEERAEFVAKQGKAREKDFIKRVIAVPGDTVRVTPGYVLVDDVQYSHENLRLQLSGFMYSDGRRRVRLIDGHVLADGRRVTKAEVAAAFGKPNAKVKIVPGKVYINGKAVEEPYIAEDADRPYPSMDTPSEWVVASGNGSNKIRSVKVPEGKLLVMGDNRNDSNDARFWGLLDRERVLGKAMFIFWPLSRIRWIH